MRCTPVVYVRSAKTFMLRAGVALLVMAPVTQAWGSGSLISSGTRDWVAAATSGRADMLILGDSVVNHGLMGWTGGISQAASSRIGLAGTGLVALADPGVYSGAGGGRVFQAPDWVQSTGTLPSDLKGFAPARTIPRLGTDRPSPKFVLGLGANDNFLDRSAGYDWQLWVAATGDTDGSIQALRASRIQSPWTRQVLETSTAVTVAANVSAPQLVEFSFAPAPGDISDWHEFGLINTSRDTAIFYNRLIDPNATGITVTGWSYSGGSMNDFVTDLYDNGRLDQDGRAAYLAALVHGNSGKLNVVIAMGVNDSGEGEPSLTQGITPGYSAEAFIDNIQTQIALTTADWAHAGFAAEDLSFTLPSTYQLKPENWSELRVARLLEYRDALRALAATDPRISFIDMWENSPTAEEAVDLNYIHDGVHPSLEGARLYGASFMNELLEETPITGDLNGDGVVGVEDLYIVLQNWNVSFDQPWLNIGASNDYRADPTYDGFVGSDDLDLVLTNWNDGSPPPAEATDLVPEPGMLGLVAALFPSLIARRRRRN